MELFSISKFLPKTMIHIIVLINTNSEIVKRQESRLVGTGKYSVLGTTKNNIV